jgi:WD40 repeat protein
VVEISPNARLLLTLDSNRNVLKLVETSGGRQLVSVDMRSYIDLLSAHFSGDSRHVAMPTISGDIRLIDADELPSFTRWYGWLNHKEGGLSHDGRLLAVATPDRFVRLIEVTTKREVALLQHDGSAYPDAFSPNDRFLVTYQYQAQAHTVHLMDVSSGKE